MLYSRRSSHIEKGPTCDFVTESLPCAQTVTAPALAAVPIVSHSYRFLCVGTAMNTCSLNFPGQGWAEVGLQLYVKYSLFLY